MKRLYRVLVDLEKAFDSTKGNYKMAMWRQRVPKRLIELVMGLDECMKLRMKTEVGTSDEFKIGVGGSRGIWP